MRCHTLTLLTGLALAAPALATPAVHQAGEWYVGGKVSGALYGQPCSAGSLSCDELSGAAGVYGGVQLKDWLALEGGVEYLGGPVATYPALSQPQSQVDYEASVAGVELGVKADYALNERVLMFGKGGGVYWLADKEADEPIAGPLNDSDSGVSLMLGTGLEYRLFRDLSTRFEYQYIDGVGDETTGQSDVHFFSVGLDYRFGGTPTPVVAPVAPPEPEVLQVEPEVRAVPEPVRVETFTQVLSGTSNAALFDSNSAALTPHLKLQLLPVLSRLTTYPETTVSIVGHTDNVGAAHDNQWLSQVRAQSVADYLAQHGVSRARMTVRGMGELSPIASNTTASGRAHNRRVEIVSPEVTTQTKKQD